VAVLFSLMNDDTIVDWWEEKICIKQNSIRENGKKNVTRRKNVRRTTSAETVLKCQAEIVEQRLDTG